MPIPDYQKLMLPILRLASKKNEYSLLDVYVELDKSLRLSQKEKETRLPSGKNLFYDRVHWATLYLKHAGLIEQTRRAHFKITNRGLTVLKQNPRIIDNQFLKRYPEFLKYIQPSNNEKKRPISTKNSSRKNK